MVNMSRMMVKILQVTFKSNVIIFQSRAIDTSSFLKGATIIVHSSYVCLWSTSGQCCKKTSLLSVAY